MNLKNKNKRTTNRVFFYILLFTLLSACDWLNPDPAADGVIKISEIKNKHDYSFPLKIQNDRGATVLLNQTPVIFNDQLFDLPHAGFYEMQINDLQGNKIILFNLIDDERGETEWGLKKWIPRKEEITPFSNEDFKVLFPQNTCDGINFPLVIYALKNNKLALVNNSAHLQKTNDQIFIKNGFGSVNIPAENGQNNSLSVGQHTFSITPKKISTSNYKLSGKLENNLVILENSLVEIEGDLTIVENASLTVNEGAIIKVAPKANIYNFGPIHFNGTSENPILLTCSEKNKYWGGFISENNSGEIKANHAFFTFSGYHKTGQFELGHAKQQALFQTTNSVLQLTDCYLLDNLGQVFYAESSTLQLTNVLIQRAKTGGQLNWSIIEIYNCIFSDFPDDTQIYQDNDNDGLYIDGCNVIITNSIFMNAKDDGIDSGGGGGGEIIVKNSRFESCFHEGAALSSEEPAVKTHFFTNCIFRNNGQGLELGYSSLNHCVFIDSCLFENNHVGIRYGDNYTWEINGNMEVTNSISRNNDRDVWNMQRKNWAPNLSKITFTNTFVSKKNEQYPLLPLIE